MKAFLTGLGVVLLALPVGWRVWSWDRGQVTQMSAADIEAGKTLFHHVWTPNDPLAGGDGLGPVFNARSCIECHFQGGAGGGGGLGENVTMFFKNSRGPGSAGVLHTQAISERFLETGRHLDPSLPAVSRFDLASLRDPRRGGGSVILTQRNSPAIFGARLIDELPDRVILATMRTQSLVSVETAGRALVLADGRIGRFGWRAQTASLLDFVQGACANELGLSNPGHAQPVSLAVPDHRSPGEDLTLEQCRQMAVFLAALPRPVERPRAGEEDDVHAGKRLFHNLGCAECHTPTVGSIEGIYSDLLLHKMGPDLSAGGFYYGELVSLPNAPREDEWRTPPLWGVADSAPYLHDGRAATLEDAIRQHGGQALGSSHAFQALPQHDRARVITFLKALRAPGH